LNGSIQTSGPYQRERGVRLFVSSTFEDMYREREELVKFVFPQVRRHCEQRGIAFNEVDLRWGITSEQAGAGLVLPICLDEVRRCRPFFLGLLGDRYGSVLSTLPPALLKRKPWLGDATGASITELEIRVGALAEEAHGSRALFYFREPGLGEGTSTPAVARPKLDTLKEQIRASGFPVREGFRTPAELAQLVLTDLTALIDELFPDDEAPGPLALEAQAHRAFAAARSEGYVARPEQLTALSHHVERDGLPLAVIGNPGVGKSALLSAWTARQPPGAVVAHFVGASPESTDWRVMVRRLVAELGQDTSGVDVLRGDDALRTAFWAALQHCAADGPISLVIDGLDHLEDRDGAPDLTWLPDQIPAGVRLIVSAAGGRALAEVHRRSWPTLAVTPLEPEERSALVASRLQRHGKTLEPALTVQLVSAKQAGNPLFLQTILDELRVFGVHDRLFERAAYLLESNSLPDLFDRLLTRWEQDYERDRRGLVGDVMRMVAAARRGLEEAELLDLLGGRDGPLPQAIWSPLHFAAEHLLSSRSGLLGFAQDEFARAIEARYLLNPADWATVHLRLADYFDGRERTPRTREELPWQLARAGSWGRLAALLADPDLLNDLWQYADLDLRRYWIEIEAASPGRIVDTYRSLIGSPRDGMTSAFIAGVLLAQTGHHDEAISALEAVRDVYQEAFRVGDLDLSEEANPGLPSPATVSGSLGLLLFAQGRRREALVLHQEEQRLAERAGDYGQLAASLANQARILYATGDTQAAEQLSDRAAELLTKVDPMQLQDRSAMAPGDGERILGTLLANQAISAADRGELDRADRLHGRAQRLARQTADTDLLAYSLANQATVQMERSNLDEAARLLKQAEQHVRQLGSAAALAEIFLQQAVIADRTGRVDEVQPLIDMAEDLADENEDLHHKAEALRLRALIAAQKDDQVRAAELLEGSLDRARQLQDPRLLHEVLTQRAGALLALGRLRETYETFVEDTDVCRRLGQRAELAVALFCQVWAFESLVVQMRPEDLPVLVDRTRPAALFSEAVELYAELEDYPGIHVRLLNLSSLLSPVARLDRLRAEVDARVAAGEIGDAARFRTELEGLVRRLSALPWLASDMELWRASLQL
jgi:tetratricopeptide (TPR) repeat protein